MKITQVERQKKNIKRFNIYLDGKFAFGADEDLVVNRRLIVGKEIPSEDLPQILFEGEVGKLMERMYALFARRQRSEREVKEYLKQLSFKNKVKGKDELSEMVIESLVEKLKEKQLINDDQFARSWVNARRNSKKKGKVALKMELFQKGINKDTINDVIEEDFDEEKEEDLARQALEKKLKTWRGLEGFELKRKAIDFLMRKGFEYETAKDVVENLLKAIQESSLES
jgi:regulatory protein